MPGLIQRNNDEDSSDDESEEDEDMPVALEEYTIGGEDEEARLPGEPMRPPRG
jgi:hypothetical protein